MTIAFSVVPRLEPESAACFSLHRAGVAIVLVLMTLSCHGSGRTEAASLDDAVERYRRAEGAERAVSSRAVGEVPCTVADVCDAKRACMAATEETTKALALKDDVAVKLGDLVEAGLSFDPQAARPLPAQLDEASRLLQQGRTSMADCERKLADLRLRYGR